MLGTIKRANAPGPPEHSITFRVATTGAVMVSIVACQVQGELSTAVAAGSIVLVALGNLFSYRRRANPPGWLKVVLAAAVVAAFTWFIMTVGVRTSAGDLSVVVGPLAVLFTVIQVTHAFDVPARRDLGFSLAGSGTLMAVAAAQAVDTSFAAYVVVWLGCCLTGLLAMWGSMAGGAVVRVRTVVTATLAVLAVGLVVVAVLPATHADSSLVFPSALAGDTALGGSASLVGGPTGSEPLHAGNPAGPTRVGGYLGFSGPLDTAVRGTLGDQVVMRVRADRPTFWVAETYNQWNGLGWTKTSPRAGKSPYFTLTGGPPFAIPPVDGDTVTGARDLQTFYIAAGGPNLVFHASEATEVWFPSRRLFVSNDDTILAGTTMGPGSIYTVDSAITDATPAQLRGSPPPGSETMLPTIELAEYLQLPGNRYPRVHALAERITAGIPAGNTYDKVVALEHWIGTHTRYTTDIPPLAPGQDTVVEFLFGNRRGYCEQISTSLAVMLRTLGIPAREVTGYVPGSYNPLTDLWEVQAKDAHAWVQVWFPGYGWQDFDPTAQVPLANPTPADVLGHDLSTLIDRVPPVPAGAAALVLVVLFTLRRWRRTAPRTWAAAVARDLVAAARRAGLDVTDDEALLTVAARLEAAVGARSGGGPGPVELATAAERSSFGGVDPGPARVRELRRAARRLRAGARRRRSHPRPPTTPSPPPGPASTSHRQPAGAATP